MNLPDPDDDLDIPCVQCGRRSEEVRIRYMHDPITLEVYGYCDLHYRALLVASHGEEVAEAVLVELAHQQLT